MKQNNPNKTDNKKRIQENAKNLNKNWNIPYKKQQNAKPKNFRINSDSRLMITDT